jgi:DNA-binding GntR family transcriptional regulator
MTDSAFNFASPTTYNVFAQFTSQPLQTMETEISTTPTTKSKPDQALPLTIVEELKRKIYAGEFKPGDRLNEAALALRMGTSRGPIREAIRVLVGIGLVISVMNRGMFVREMSVKEMLEIYDLRALLFGFAAQRATVQINDEHRRQFETLLSRMDHAAKAEDSDLYYTVNLEFHNRILALSNNRRAQQADDEYAKELHLFRRRNFNSPAKMRSSNVEHRKIYEAIVKGDKAKAKQAAEAHIMAGRQRLLDALDDSSSMAFLSD